MSEVVTVYHMGHAYPNLTVPHRPEYAGIRPMCPQCLRFHCNEPSLVVDGVQGCLQCVKATPDKYPVAHKREIIARYKLPRMPDDLTAICTLSALGGCDDVHLEWVETLPGKHPGHLGNVGERLDLTLECTQIEPKGHDDYGAKFLVKFGPNVVWWTHESSLWPKVGETRSFRATVSKHDYFNGTPQTVVSRCQVPKVKGEVSREL